MSDTENARASWAERAADRSPKVQRSRARSMEQATAVVAAARRLLEAKGSSFTTQELVKEAGIALQTFYRYFASKDQLLLAVIEDMVTQACRELERQAQAIADPVERLRSYISFTAVRANVEGDDQSRAMTVVTEHWRLQQLYPEQLAEAISPFNNLILRELRSATEAGLLAPTNPEYDAWLVTQLVVAVYHHYAFAPRTEAPEQIAERLWSFCLGALHPTGTGADPDRPRVSRRQAQQRPRG